MMATPMRADVIAAIGRADAQGDARHCRVDPGAEGGWGEPRAEQRKARPRQCCNQDDLPDVGVERAGCRQCREQDERPEQHAGQQRPATA